MEEREGKIELNQNEKPWHCCVHSVTGKSLIQQKEILTFLLAAIGGFCDTITFLKGNHTFSGHITGNIVVFFASYFGNIFSAGQNIDWVHLLIIPQFAICVALGGRIVYRFGPELLLLLMGIILCIAGIIPWVFPKVSPYIPSLIAVVAMAFQNAFNDLHQTSVHMKTTIVTGTFTRISLVLSNMLCLGPWVNSILGEPKYLQANGNDISANKFLLDDDYFEPNPILERESDARNKAHQKISNSEQEPVDDRPSSSSGKVNVQFRPSVGVKLREKKMIDLPGAATYHFEDLCGPALGMVGFVGGCALGSFMGVVLDLRGLLIPGVLLLIIWFALHYDCQCSCTKEISVEERGISMSVDVGRISEGDKYEVNNAEKNI